MRRALYTVSLVDLEIVERVRRNNLPYRVTKR